MADSGSNPFGAPAGAAAKPDPMRALLAARNAAFTTGGTPAPAKGAAPPPAPAVHAAGAGSAVNPFGVSAAEGQRCVGARRRAPRANFTSATAKPPDGPPA
jgi:hypothetical protein